MGSVMKPAHLICTALLAAAPLALLPSCKDNNAPVASEMQHKGLSAEQRATVFSSLALLPKNVTDFVVLTGAGDTLTRLAQSGTVPGLTPERLTPAQQILDNSALAVISDPATHKLLLEKMDVFSRLCGVATLLGKNDHDLTNLQGCGSMVESYANSLLESADISVADIEAIHLPTCYFVLTVKPGNEEHLRHDFEEALGAMQQSASEPGVTPFKDINGFSGVSYSLSQAAELQDAADDDQKVRDIKKHLRSRNIFVATRLQGNAIILTLCEDPAKVKVADKPSDSVLATGKLLPCDDKLDKGMLLYAYVSKESATFLSRCSMGGLSGLSTGAAETFRKLAQEDAANKLVYDKAAAGTDVLTNAAKQLSAPANAPSTLQLWYDGVLHMQAEGDARGASYKPGTQRLASVAANPATILYAESTPMDRSTTMPGLMELATAFTDMAKGLALTANEQDSRELNEGLVRMEAFTPELQALNEACRTITSGFDGHCAFVMDTTQTSLPPMMASRGNATAVMPRLGIFAGVADRSRLSQGWDALLTTAGMVAGKLGSDPSIINMLPVVPATSGTTTSYKVAMPFFSADFVPSLTVSDTGFALGTSENLNNQLVSAATGSTPLAGAVFSFRPAPLAGSLKSLRKATGQSSHSPLGETSRGMQDVSELIESIQGSSTIANDVYTLKVDINFAAGEASKS